MVSRSKDAVAFVLERCPHLLNISESKHGIGTPLDFLLDMNKRGATEEKIVEMLRQKGGKTRAEVLAIDSAKTPSCDCR